MRYVSLFSGIEAASVAWEPLGWEPVAFAEIDPFPCAVLKERYPNVPNLGDVSEVDWSVIGAVDVVVGGSPCQAFSVAGKRKGMLDARGRLMLEYVRAVRDLRPRWLLWENVPGVLSQSNGDAFDTLQRELAECGYSLAWRTLDAQFFGVAQRRRRVFLVGHLGGPGGAPAAVLFEPESLRWDSESSREKRQALADEARRSPQVAGFKYSAGSAAKGLGYEEESTNTLTADWHAPAVFGFAQNSRDEVRLIGGDGSLTGALTATQWAKQQTYVTQYGEEMAGTLTARHDSSPCADRGQNIVCLSDDNAKAAVDAEVSGTLKCGGSAPMVAL
ncbi:MAG: DNA cytosine methyltransferase [Coriobacteriia bacterium]|nr:DNA cytosine methyltransferase [Coriobacteriia bacterium]